MKRVLGAVGIAALLAVAAPVGAQAHGYHRHMMYHHRMMHYHHRMMHHHPPMMHHHHHMHAMY